MTCYNSGEWMLTYDFNTGFGTLLNSKHRNLPPGTSTLWASSKACIKQTNKQNIIKNT